MTISFEKWADTWFGPAPAERLALLRFSSGSFALWYLLTRYDMMLQISRSAASNFEAVGLAKLFEAPINPEIFHGLLILTLVLNLLYLAGWQFKWLGPAFSVLLLFVLSYRNSWSMIYHSNNALVLHVLIIGWTPAADALSIDAWLRRKKVFRLARSHAHYGWPVLLLCLATALTYFLAGFAKVSSDLAWNWASGEAMRGQVAADALRKVMYGGEVEAMFKWLYPHKWIFMGMGVTALVLELGAPLFLIRRRLGMLWAVLTWMMHWGIFFIMGITFRYQLSGLIFLPFFDVEKGVEWIKRRVMREEQGIMNKE